MPTNANINLKGSEIISRCSSSLTNVGSQKMFVAQENEGLSFSDLAIVAVLAFLCTHQNLFSVLRATYSFSLVQCTEMLGS